MTAPQDAPAGPVLGEEDLRAIRGRADRATPGPWMWQPGSVEAPAGEGSAMSTEMVLWARNIPGGDDLSAAELLGACGLRAEPDAEANLAFLAAAREDVPRLLAEVDRLRSLLSSAREEGAAAERERIAREHCEDAHRQVRLNWHIDPEYERGRLHALDDLYRALTDGPS